jgi:hypothetical protein
MSAQSLQNEYTVDEELRKMCSAEVAIQMVQKACEVLAHCSTRAIADKVSKVEVNTSIKDWFANPTTPSVITGILLLNGSKRLHLGEACSCFLLSLVLLPLLIHWRSCHVCSESM